MSDLLHSCARCGGAIIQDVIHTCPDQRVPLDDLARAADIFCQAYGASEDQRRAIGELLTAIFHNLTSTMCATLVTVAHRDESRLDKLSNEVHLLNLRLDQARIQIDAQEERLTALEVGAPKVSDR